MSVSPITCHYRLRDEKTLKTGYDIYLAKPVDTRNLPGLIPQMLHKPSEEPKDPQ